MHNGNSRRLLALFAFSVLSFACSDDPTEQNALLAPQLPFQAMAIRESTITASGGFTYKQIEPMNGTVNLVGRSGNYSASTLIAFYASYFPTRDTVNVLSAKLMLHGASFYGDSTGVLSFTVHRVDLSWNQSTFTWDSLQSSLYDPTVVRGSYTGKIGLDTEEVDIQLDTAMARVWLSTTTDYSQKYGMILVPTSSCSVVRGFCSFESDSSNWVPQLDLICQNVAGTVIDTTIYSLGVDTFVGNIDNLDSQPNILYVQAGVVYRSVLTFDVGFLPKGATVNAATLMLQRDPATSRLNRFAADTSVDVHIIQDSTTSKVFESTYAAARLVPGSQTSYAADVHRAVQSWIRGPNYGLALRTDGAREFESFDLTTFFGPTADDAHKPHLKIIYAVPKK